MLNKKILKVILLILFFSIKNSKIFSCEGGNYFCNYYIYNLARVKISSFISFDSSGNPTLNYQANIPTKKRNKKGNMIYIKAPAVLDPSFGVLSLPTDDLAPLILPNPPKYNFICTLSQDSDEFKTFLKSGYIKEIALGMNISCPGYSGRVIGCDCAAISNSEAKYIDLCSSTYYGTLGVRQPCSYQGKSCTSLKMPPKKAPVDYPKILAYIECMNDANSGNFNNFNLPDDQKNKTSAINYCNTPTNQYNSQSLNLVKSSLKDANLVNKNLYDANLTSSNLIGANLKGAIADGVNFKNANLFSATWTDGSFCQDQTCGGKAKAISPSESSQTTV